MVPFIAPTKILPAAMIGSTSTSTRSPKL